MYIWVTRWVFIRSRNCLLFARTWVHPQLSGGIRLAHLFRFCVFLVCVFAFWVPCCLYLQLFVERLIYYLCYLCLFVHSGVQHILCCDFCFVFLRLRLCWQCLWIVHFWLPLRYPLKCIYYSWYWYCNNFTD